MPVVEIRIVYLIQYLLLMAIQISVGFGEVNGYSGMICMRLVMVFLMKKDFPDKTFKA